MAVSDVSLSALGLPVYKGAVRPVKLWWTKSAFWPAVGKAARGRGSPWEAEQALPVGSRDYHKMNYPGTGDFGEPHLKKRHTQREGTWSRNQHKLRRVQDEIPALPEALQSQPPVAK